MRNRFLMLLVAAMAFAWRPGPALSAGGELPRYRLQVGQELTYETTIEFKAERSAMNEGSTAVFDVVSGDPQTGWHIVGRIASWDVQNGVRQQSDGDVVAFDLKPDGTATLSPNSVPSTSIPDVFPALPRDEAQLKGEWQRDALYGGRIIYTSPTDAANSFAFKGEIVDPIYRIYLIKRQLTFQFDSARGLLESWTSKDSQGYGFVGAGTGRAVLKDVQVRPPQLMAQVSRDCEVYLDAMARNTEARRAALDDPTKCESLLKESNNRLADARAQIATPDLIALLDKQISTLPSRTDYYVQEVRERQAILGKPSPDWTLADQTGAKHSLGDYRGKVVVLDFWYRGCGWCMRAMPEMQQLSRDYAGKPVALLGMNTDGNPADVKFVVDAFGLDYPILHLENDFPAKYHVHGFPTVIVIGPDGIVRDFIVGYSQDNHERLTKKIQALVDTR